MTRLFVPLDNVPFFAFLFHDLGLAPHTPGQDPAPRLLEAMAHTPAWRDDLGPLADLDWRADPFHQAAIVGVTGLNERPNGLVFYGLTAQSDRGTAHAVLYRAPDRWRLERVGMGEAATTAEAILEELDQRFVISPNQELSPCPCCSHRFPAFQQLGTPARPSVVSCGNCSFSLESKEEAEQNGIQWNRLAQLAMSTPRLVRPAVSEVCGAHCQAVALRSRATFVAAA